MTYKNIFKNRYPELKGSDWIKTVSTEDRKAFIQIGFIASECGRKGGRARSQGAKKDYRGRFIKS